MTDSEDSGQTFREFMVQCNEWYEKASQKRYKRFGNGYVWDKWIGTGLMLVCFAYLLFVANSYNYALDYYKCGSDIPDYVTPEEPEMCENPFYKPQNAWKGQEYLPTGEYGTKPGPLFWSIQYVPILLFVMTALLNTLIHNYSMIKKRCGK